MRREQVPQFQWLAGIVLAWVDLTGDDCTGECPVLQQGLEASWRQEDTGTYFVNHHSGSSEYTDGWTFRKPTVRRSNYVVGCQSDDNASRGQSLLSDGSTGREYANVVWGGGQGISPSSAGGHPLFERPKHLCVG